MPPTISMMAISIGVSNSTVLMKSCASAPISAAGRNASSTLSDEATRTRIVRERQGDARQLDGVDAENGQDGAELDQHLERLAGRADAEEVLGKQEMAGRRYGQELGKALDEAQEDHFPDRHRWPLLRGFSCAAARISRICRNAVPLPRHTKRLSYRTAGPYERCSIKQKQRRYLSNAHTDALPALPLFARRAPGARRARHRRGALRGAPVGVAAGVSRPQPGGRVARAATGGRARRCAAFTPSRSTWPRRSRRSRRKPTPWRFPCSPATAPSAPRPAA